MRHRGVQVGNFFLGEKQNGPEFTAEDEEVLVLFASQAATAVANARTHRAEQRARADLEALVETSPVAVAVFDARSGRPVLTNREARRLVEGLRTAGRPVEELLQVATCRFSDGSEIALTELPLPQVLGSARTLRTEEVVVSVPDGRRLTVLANTTPIRSDGGEVVSGDRHPPGPGAASGAGAVAGGLPRHGEPQAARAAGRDQGLGGRVDRGGGRARSGRDARVLPHHRRASQPHARPHPRPARCGEHRRGHALGHTRALGRVRPGRPGAQHVPVRRRPAHRAHRPAAGPAPGDGRPAAHRAGAEQPALERRPALAPLGPDPGRGRP